MLLNVHVECGFRRFDSWLDPMSLNLGIVIPPIANTNPRRGNDFVMSGLPQREVGRIRITVEPDKSADGK